MQDWRGWKIDIKSEKQFEDELAEAREERVLGQEEQEETGESEK